MPLLVFAITLYAAVLISGLAARSVLSTSVLFLVAGFVAGDRLLGIVHLDTSQPVVSRFVELALFSVLFTGGMRSGVSELTSAWRLPGRALLLGLPLTLIGNALIAHYLVQLSWLTAFLVGAALSPTDPVFATALIGSEEVPARLRHLLNVESGLNDGMALPVVVALMSIGGRDGVTIAPVLADVALGVAFGIAIPWVAIRLLRVPFFGPAGLYEPLTAFAIGIVLLAASRLSHANEFLAAFTGGIVVATVCPEVRDAFHRFGELLAELLKLAALLVFGALVRVDGIAALGWHAVLFVALALVLVRPAALAVALLGAGIDRREWVAAAWFGPKGFASVFFAILILQAGVPDAVRIFHLLAFTVAASIVAHSSTDVLVARWFRKADPEPAGSLPH